MGLRIRLVEPRPAGHNVYDLVLLPRLGLPLMGAMLRAEGHDVRIYCEVLSPVDLGDCLAADLVGISSTTATSPAAYRLADVLGAAGVPVVLGGPHVSFRPDEALGHAPFVVRGEGEATMLELVERLERGLPLEEVRGLSSRGDGAEPRHGPNRPRCSRPWSRQASRRTGSRRSARTPSTARGPTPRSTTTSSTSCATRAARW
ncbi:MAG TPA: cobalamin-dependent protein [Acidimicrobiales bacterium]|nr:cobalamin-dependent protein [Acidimicrobiales bacterium]